MSAPVTSALARRTDTPTYKPPCRYLSPILSREDRPEAGQTAATGHDRLHQSAREDRSNSAPGLWTTLRQQLKARSSRSLP